MQVHFIEYFAMGKMEFKQLFSLITKKDWHFITTYIKNHNIKWGLIVFLELYNN